MNSDPFVNEAGRRLPARGVILSEDMPPILFCTVCTKDRGTWLACEEVKALLHHLWQHEADAWLIGHYVLMPDHLHFLCCPRDPGDIVEVEAWSTFWKSRFSKGARRKDWRWQRGLFHTRMRSDAHYQEKLEYIRDNPVTKGLVRKHEDWPWRGVVHDLDAYIRSFGQPPSK